eukprot:13791648-Alexandrium_andersonii.AAC.1
MWPAFTVRVLRPALLPLLRGVRSARCGRHPCSAVGWLLRRMSVAGQPPSLGFAMFRSLMRCG